MKKLGLLLASLALLGVSKVSAQLIINIDRVPGYYLGSGGELNVAAAPGDPAFAPFLALYAPAAVVNGGFETWCMEAQEHLFGGPYSATISDQAILGGNNYTTPPGSLGGDVLSKGTAYLYMLFASGTLPGYDYTPGLGRMYASAPLQNVFWLLEDEYQLNVMDATQTAMYNSWINLLIAQFGSLGIAKSDNAGLYPVGMLNVIRLADNTHAQDVLILLPHGTPPPPGDPLDPGDTATIGFWQNKNGQGMIKNACPGLPNWLAGNFPCLYGNLAGKANNDVAALFLNYFNVKGQKTYAQVLGAALACYFTDDDLNCNPVAAVKFGFNISDAGTGAKTYNVGANGTILGLQNNTSYTVFELLQAANAKCQWNAGVFNALNVIFDGINQSGDIK